MPRYKVKAFDGKTLTIEAPDEAALDEAMSDYESQTKSSEPSADAQAPSPVAQEPSRLKSALAGAIPGGQTYLASQNPDASFADKLGAASGDLMNAALMVGSGGTAGLLKQAALGAGAGALAPELTKLSQYGSEKGGNLAKYTPIGALAGLIPANTRSMPLQILRNSPEMAGQIVGSALPQALLAFLGKGMQKVTGESLAPTQAAQSLEALGGRPTAAQSLKPGIAGGISHLLESSARTNPLLEGKYRAIDEANAGAVANKAKGSFGADILDPESAANTGSALKGNLDTLARQRSAEYAPAVEALKGAKGYTKFGKDIVGSAIKAGAENGVLPDVAALWEKNSKGLANANTPAKVDLEFQNMRHRFATQFADLKAADASAYGAAERSFAIMERAAKDSYYNGLNKIQPGLGDQIREAKGDYAEASQAMSPLSKALAAKGENAPEQVGPRVLKSGSSALERLTQDADPQTRQSIQQQLARTILEQSKGKDGLSSSRLESQLNSNRSATPMLGNQAQALQELLALGKAAGQENLGQANPSGTAVTLGRLGHAGAAFQPQLWPALLGKMAMDLGYTYGGRPALKLGQVGLGAVGQMAPSLQQAMAMGSQGMTLDQAKKLFSQGRK